MGLTYAQQRWYDATTGRFLSEDPVGAEAYLGMPTSMQPWVYANGNPLKFTDPNGLSGVDSASAWAEAACFGAERASGGRHQCSPAKLEASTEIARNAQNMGTAAGVAVASGIGVIEIAPALGAMAAQFAIKHGMKVFIAGKTVDAVGLGLSSYQCTQGSADACIDANAAVRDFATTGAEGETALAKGIFRYLRPRPGRNYLLGAAQAPKLKWAENPTGEIRTAEEAVEIARKFGVDIPDDIQVF
ncbi:RHS repeat-associated core domain-containing protein, partial [Myxococcus vastator]|uniref:RHS repeat-associated core domain-containing protein n=1 Tax=Myxococcus vastator TaxID=2709664 RepID=UPI0023DE0C61